MFDIFHILGLIVVCAPLGLTIVLGVATLASAPLSERTTSIPERNYLSTKAARLSVGGTG